MRKQFLQAAVFVCVGVTSASSAAQEQREDQRASAPPLTSSDAREIPVPPIATPLGTLPGVRELPTRPDMPDVMVMDDGTRVTSRSEWDARRQEMRRILAYYAIGQAPPAPGNVRGRQVHSEVVLDGMVKYRLVRLSLGHSPGTRDSFRPTPRLPHG